MTNIFIQKLRNISKIKLVLGVFVFLDLLWIYLHFTHGQQTEALNIDLERNIPTFYQGFKLILVSCVIFAGMVLGYVKQGGAIKKLYAFLPYLLGFIYLAIDEVGMVHETLHISLQSLNNSFITGYENFFIALGFTSAKWLIYYLPALALAAVYFLWLAKHYYREERALFPIFALAVAMFLLVPVVEFFNTTDSAYSGSFNYLNTLVAIEEYLEMAGTTFFLAFNTYLLKKYITKTKV
jgi:hypothetical protein